MLSDVDQVKVDVVLVIILQWMEEILHHLGNMWYLWTTVNIGIIIGQTTYELAQDFLHPQYYTMDLDNFFLDMRY